MIGRREKKIPFLILTECGITSRLQVELSSLSLVGSCMLCRYMKSNSLELIRNALRHLYQPIEIDPTIQQQALDCVNAMLQKT